MATRIPRGTASDKESGTTLTISNVEAKNGSMLVVAVCFDNSAGDPTSVAWGSGDLVQKLRRDNATAGVTTIMYQRRRVRNGGIKDVVVTWPSAIEARAAFATELKGVNSIDDSAGNVETVGTTAPLTGQTAALEFPDDFALCVFGSAGPVSDDPGTPEIENDDVFQPANAGQRVGTVGGGALTNVTIQEVWLQLSADPSTRGRLTDATQRRWANLICAMGGKTWKVTVSGAYTAEVFLESETSEEVSDQALLLDESVKEELTITSLSVATVDSVVEQVFNTDYVK